ncbi:Hsp20/alpha crystallin family protein [Niabella sp. CC-SYL272]|uniref:Hsp20/alpha crystallin family protein n=1 Tax=Niabella agricola TaxID=2891571 RepID=UPI001F25BFAF|nr:Hsp20/alpha crystallin family protein [Niabella agricola]MCF3107651.1 Hsp20/alpha crystallin family protein [Niabella agricola]
MSKDSFFQKRNFMPWVIDHFFLPWTAWLRTNGFIGQTVIPALKVSDEKDLYCITVAAPGMQKIDFLLKTKHNQLIIKILKENIPVVQAQALRGRKHSGFSCTIGLPPEVHPNRINHHLNEGILSIFLPKKPDYSGLKATTFSNL